MYGGARKTYEPVSVFPWLRPDGHHPCLNRGALARCRRLRPRRISACSKTTPSPCSTPSSDSVLKTIPIPAGPHGLVVTPDGRWVYASSDGDSVVSVIDTSTDTVANTIEVGQTPHGLAITPDGRGCWSPASGPTPSRPSTPPPIRSSWQVNVPQPHNIAITPDGKTAYAGGQQDGAQQLAIIDVCQRHRDWLRAARPRAAGAERQPGRRRTWRTRWRASTRCRSSTWTRSSWTRRSRQASSPHHPLFTPDGKLGMVVAQGPGTLDLFDPATSTATGSIKVGTMPHWIGMTSDGRGRT